MAKTDLKTASVLAFERKLDPSGRCLAPDAGTNGQAALEVGCSGCQKSRCAVLFQQTVPQDQDPAKLDASIQSPNLQTVDVATLPNDADTLRVRFTPARSWWGRHAISL